MNLPFSTYLLCVPTSHIFYFVIRMHKLRTLICNFFHLSDRNIWTVKLKLGNSIPPKVHSHSQFSRELANLCERGKCRMVHSIFTFTEGKGIDLQIESHD
jgi:hypothetical protein